MRYYDLLIADDEYWIREKLRTVLPWENYNIRFLSPAENGEEVLKRLENENCDILITDINMPFVNGTELIRRVKETYPDIVVFALSGYDDFIYVKEALTAGAVDYLLKPVNKIDLIAAVSGALEIMAKRENEKEQALKTSSFISDMELSSFVEREPASYSRKGGFGEPENTFGYSLILIKLHDMAGLIAKYGYDMNTVSYTVKTWIRGLLTEKDAIVFNYIYRKNEFIVLSCLEREKLLSLLLKTERELSEKTQSPVTIAVSTRGYDMDTLHEAYLESVSALMTREYTRANEIIFYADISDQTNKEVGKMSDSPVIQGIRSLYQSGNETALRQFIRNELRLSGSRPADARPFRYLEIKQAVKRICQALIESSLGRLSARESGELEAEAERIDKELEHLDGNRLSAALDSFIALSFPAVRNEESGSMKEIVRKVMDYIDANYFEELSLKSLAEQYSVENSYLSRCFKQEAGMNLTQYSTGLRMKQAERYMEEGTANLTEIAFMVGYDDYGYFNRVFKKHFGISPSEYRMSKKSN